MKSSPTFVGFFVCGFCLWDWDDG